MSTIGWQWFCNKQYLNVVSSFCYKGFNTGVVLYNLAEMRRSALYNSYLTPAMVTMLEKKYMYGYTLAEQVGILIQE